jgi:DNA-binding NarL/FixJ family response regulator
MAPVLSQTQRQVYQLLRLGLNDDQIGARLRRGRRWVGYRVAEIKQALGAASRAELLHL